MLGRCSGQCHGCTKLIFQGHVSQWPVVFNRALELTATLSCVLGYDIRARLSSRVSIFGAVYQERLRALPSTMSKPKRKIDLQSSSNVVFIKHAPNNNHALGPILQKSSLPFKPMLNEGRVRVKGSRFSVTFPCSALCLRELGSPAFLTAHR